MAVRRARLGYMMKSTYEDQRDARTCRVLHRQESPESPSHPLSWADEPTLVPFCTILRRGVSIPSVVPSVCVSRSLARAAQPSHADSVSVSSAPGGVRLAKTSQRVSSMYRLCVPHDASESSAFARCFPAGFPAHRYVHVVSLDPVAVLCRFTDRIPHSDRVRDAIAKLLVKYKRVKRTTTHE